MMPTTHDGRALLRAQAQPLSGAGIRCHGRKSRRLASSASLLLVTVVLSACGGRSTPSPGAPTGFHLLIVAAPPTLFEPRALTTGADGNIWVTDAFGFVWRVTTTGLSTRFALPRPHANPLGIVKGPGGVWLAEESGRAVARIDSVGAVREFVLPRDGAPANLAIGDDGNIWVTDHLADSVWRLTPSGTFTEFPVRTPSPSPYGIARGPDGAMWFTEAESNRIGRITLNGVMQDWPLPTARSAPLEITAGRDGALWFVEQAADRLGRITVDGQVTEFHLPSALRRPVDLLSSEDGTFWVAAETGNVARIDATGTVIEVVPVEQRTATLTARDFPRLAYGPDGHPWFTAPWANGIGYLEERAV